MSRTQSTPFRRFPDFIFGDFFPFLDEKYIIIVSSHETILYVISKHLFLINTVRVISIALDHGGFGWGEKAI